MYWNSTSDINTNALWAQVSYSNLKHPITQLRNIKLFFFLQDIVNKKNTMPRKLYYFTRSNSNMVCDLLSKGVNHLLWGRQD